NPETVTTPATRRRPHDSPRHLQNRVPYRLPVRGRDGARRRNHPRTPQPRRRTLHRQPRRPRRSGGPRHRPPEPARRTRSETRPPHHVLRLPRARTMPRPGRQTHTEPETTPTDPRPPALSAPHLRTRTQSRRPQHPQRRRLPSLLTRTRMGNPKRHHRRRSTRPADETHTLPRHHGRRPKGHRIAWLASGRSSPSSSPALTPRGPASTHDCSTSPSGAGLTTTESVRRTSTRSSVSRSPRTIRENARRFRVSARKLQTPSGQCSTPSADATSTRSPAGTTTRRRSAAQRVETRPRTTPTPLLTCAYTKNAELQSQRKEIQSVRKETHLLEQGNIGT